jgi:PAS domain S-box-containing protein
MRMGLPQGMRIVFSGPFLRNTFFAAAGVLAGLPAYEALVVAPRIETLLTGSAESEAQRIAAHLLADLLPATAELTAELLPPGFERIVAEVVRDFEIVKLKVFSRSGEVIFSTDPTDVGEINTKSYFLSIVSSVELISKVVEKNEITLEGKVTKTDVVETYVPIMRNNILIGVFEIYYDVTAWKAKLDTVIFNTRRNLIVVVIFLSGFLMVFLFRAARDVRERDAAQERVRQSEKRFQDMVSTASDWFWETDEELRFTYVSDRFFEIFEIPPEQIIGKSRREFARSGEERKIWEQHFATLDAKQPFQGFSYSFLDREGRTKFLSTSGMPTFDTNGFFTGYCGVGTDVTSHELALEALGESERRFRAFAQSTPDGIISADDRGEIVFWNEGARAIFQFDESEAVGRPLSIIIPEKYRSLHQEGLNRVTAGDSPRLIGKTTQIEGLRKDQSEVAIELSLSRWRSRGRNFYSAVIRDIAERLERENAVKISEKRFGTLINSSSQGILVHRRLRTLFANSKVVEIFGFGSTEELLALKSPAELVIPEDRDRLIGCFEKRLKGHALPSENEYKGLRKDGREIWLNSRTFQIDWDGEPALCHAVFDITESKNMQLHLVQKSKSAALGEMTTGIAHELNQPLNVIRMASESAAEALEESSVPIDFLKGKLERIAFQTTRAAAIIDRMRIFDDVSTDQFEPICAMEAVCGATSLMKEQFRLRGIDLEMDLPESSRKALGHFVSLKQVFMSILANAREAIEKKAKEPGADNAKGLIRVTVMDDREMDTVKTVIWNAGDPIPEAVLPRIFDPFFTTKTVGEGPGLGLFVSHQIVSEMKGKIEAANIDGGVGLTVSLPAAEEKNSCR